MPLVVRKRRRSSKRFQFFSFYPELVWPACQIAQNYSSQRCRISRINFSSAIPAILFFLRERANIFLTLVLFELRTRKISLCLRSGQISRNDNWKDCRAESKGDRDESGCWKLLRSGKAGRYLYLLSRDAAVQQGRRGVEWKISRKLARELSRLVTPRFRRPPSLRKLAAPFVRHFASAI